MRKQRGAIPRKRAEAIHPGKRAADESAEARILEAARKVFALHSFRAASTRMIAEEAGVDHPLIHYYFGSKEKLFEAVTARIFKEYGDAQIAWLEGVEVMSPRAGLSLYLDRLLDYNLARPEALQLILINMAQIGRLDDMPGYDYIRLNMNRIRETLEQKIPIRGSQEDTLRFIHSLHTLLISLVGARSFQAEILKLDPDSVEYRTWVKDALLLLFLPSLERLIFPERYARKPKATVTANRNE